MGQCDLRLLPDSRMNGGPPFTESSRRPDVEVLLMASTRVGVLGAESQVCRRESWRVGASTSPLAGWHLCRFTPLSAARVCALWTLDTCLLPSRPGILRAETCRRPPESVSPPHSLPSLHLPLGAPSNSCLHFLKGVFDVHRGARISQS